MILLELYTANISVAKNSLFTCVLKAHVLPLYFFHKNNCKFYIKLNEIFYTGINAILTRNKCNFYTRINVFASMYIYSSVKITFINVQKLHLFQCKDYTYLQLFNYTENVYFQCPAHVYIRSVHEPFSYMTSYLPLKPRRQCTYHPETKMFMVNSIGILSIHSSQEFLGT